MAYQDDFRNKVLQALKAKNLAVDISQEETQQAIVEEAQNVAAQESRPMSPEEMKLVLQDVANQLAVENQQFTAQSADFTAFKDQQAGGPKYTYISACMHAYINTSHTLTLCHTHTHTFV